MCTMSHTEQGVPAAGVGLRDVGAVVGSSLLTWSDAVDLGGSQQSLWELMMMKVEPTLAVRLDVELDVLFIRRTDGLGGYVQDSED